jgi:hypothetical protein
MKFSLKAVKSQKLMNANCGIDLRWAKKTSSRSEC